MRSPFIPDFAQFFIEEFISPEIKTDAEMMEGVQKQLEKELEEGTGGVYPTPSPRCPPKVSAFMSAFDRHHVDFSNPDNQGVMASVLRAFREAKRVHSINQPKIPASPFVSGSVVPPLRRGTPKISRRKNILILCAGGMKVKHFKGKDKRELTMILAKELLLTEHVVLKDDADFYCLQKDSISVR